MYQRSRSHNHAQDWDPMREEYQSSTHASQYHDDEANTDNGVQLDHSKLYVTNIPKTLNQDGLRNLFSKYGNCLRVFLSENPSKRFAFVWYETPGEAQLAIMKLNKIDPLQLHIHTAHKKDNDQRGHNQRSSTGYRDDVSVGSKTRYSRKLEEVSNGDNNHDDDVVVDDDKGLLDEGLDTNLVLEIEELKLKHLKLQEAQIQCKQRMLLLNRIGKNTSQKSMNRCMLPDGRIVVRNANERTEHHQDVAFTSAAGDSLTLPALQRVSSRSCLTCGLPADSYCARCGLAPYCNLRCQSVDWARRHRSVCHNLARLNESKDNGKGVEVEQAVKPAVQPPPMVQAAPLRRPHSPNKSMNTKRHDKREDVNASDVQNKNPYQNKSYRVSMNSKNRNIRRPMQQNTTGNNAIVRDAEESFEPKERKETATKTEPTQPSPVKSSAPNEKPKLPFYKKPVAAEPDTPQPYKEQEAKRTTKALTVNDTTPTRKLVPKKYVVETLSIGDSVLLSVDAKAADCKSKTDGYICLSLHEASEHDYQQLCADYSADCDAETALYKPNPGELFSYCNPEDGAWYRAKLLNATQAALIDSSKVVTISSSDKCKRMTSKYENIPEFCCALDAKNVQIGNNLKCTVIAKTEDGFKVLLEDAETGSSVGEGVVSRWKPQVDHAVPTNGTQAVAVPVVQRPDLINKTSVLLVDGTAMDSIFVRPSDTDSLRKYDGILQDVLQYGMTAKPIQEPPQKGQVVIGKFTDGNCYRALCKRTNVSQNKYLLEYIEFGNTDINTKETIYECPPELNLESQPTVVSLVKLRVGVNTLTAAGFEYIEKIKDTATELTMTLADGSKSAPSGAEVNLIVSKNKESMNKKLEELCTPDWKKLEINGGDVIQSPTFMYSDLEHLELPEDGCELDVLDVSVLSFGSVNACLKDLPYAKEVFTTLTEQMTEYCNSEIGREPYLPNLEELCIAQCPTSARWERGVVCELERGAGGRAARVCAVDRGDVRAVPVPRLRKMMPDFVRARPALATHLELRGFPENPSEEMLARALAHMKVNDEGRGELKVTRCEKIEPGLYIVDAPDLLEAMGV